MCILVLPESKVDSLGGNNREESMRSRYNRFNHSFRLQLTRHLLDLCLDQSVFSIQEELPSIYTHSSLGLEDYELEKLSLLTYNLTY